MLSPSSIADRFWDYPNDGIVELREELERILKLDGKYSDLVLLEKVEELLPQVRRVLSRKIESCDQKGVTPNFRFSDFSENRLVGCVISEKEETVKNKLVHRKGFYQLINQLEWKALRTSVSTSCDYTGSVNTMSVKEQRTVGLTFSAFMNHGQRKNTLGSFLE